MTLLAHVWHGTRQLTAPTDSVFHWYPAAGTVPGTARGTTATSNGPITDCDRAKFMFQTTNADPSFREVLRKPPGYRVAGAGTPLVTSRRIPIRNISWPVRSSKYPEYPAPDTHRRYGASTPSVVAPGGRGVLRLGVPATCLVVK